MGPILPGQERPTTLTENLYSVRGTMVSTRWNFDRKCGEMDKSFTVIHALQGRKYAICVYCADGLFKLCCISSFRVNVICAMQYVCTWKVR